MKVLMLNGSPHASGVNNLALREMEAVFKESGVETETVQVGNLAVRGCSACGACTKLGKCVYDDIVNELLPKFEKADGLVVSSPVYYAILSVHNQPESWMRTLDFFLPTFCIFLYV